MDGVGRVDVGTGEDLATAGARDRKRDSLFMTAVLRIADEPETREVRVRNLSAGGLMIEHDRPIAPGAVVHLAMRGLGDLTGSVAWSTRGRVGVALDEPIDPKRARKPVGTGKGTPGYAKPLLVARAPRR